MRKWINSLGFAIEGLIRFIRTERNGRIEGVIAVLVIICGFIFRISQLEWILILLCIGGVMGMEALNTAIEKLSDIVSPEKDDRIRIVKDISAGAVLISSIVAVVIGLIIFIPHLRTFLDK